MSPLQSIARGHVSRPGILQHRFRYTFLPAGYSVLRFSGSWCIHNVNKTSDSCLKNPQHETCFLLPLQLQTPALHYTKGGEKSCSERNTAGVHCTDTSCLHSSVGYSPSGVHGTWMFINVFTSQPPPPSLRYINQYTPSHAISLQ